MKGKERTGDHPPSLERAVSQSGQWSQGGEGQSSDMIGILRRGQGERADRGPQAVAKKNLRSATNKDRKGRSRRQKIATGRMDTEEKERGSLNKWMDCERSAGKKASVDTGEGEFGDGIVNRIIEKMD